MQGKEEDVKNTMKRQIQNVGYSVKYLNWTPKKINVMKNKNKNKKQVMGLL